MGDHTKLWETWEVGNSGKGQRTVGEGTGDKLGNCEEEED